MRPLYIGLQNIFSNSSIVSMVTVVIIVIILVDNICHISAVPFLYVHDDSVKRVLRDVNYIHILCLLLMLLLLLLLFLLFLLSLKSALQLAFIVSSIALLCCNFTVTCRR